MIYHVQVYGYAVVHFALPFIGRQMSDLQYKSNRNIQTNMATSVEEVWVKCIEYIDINRFVLALKYLILFELKHVCFQKYHKV